MRFHASCIFVILGALVGISAGDKCPANENISPCTCKNLKNDAYVTCTSLPNSDELRDALAGIKGINIYSLEVKESNLGAIPGYLFKDTCIEDLKFSYTKVTSIGDDDNNLPFSGLENCLRRLTIIEGFWDYDKPLTKPIKLHHLKKLVYLNMENNVIPKLGNDWFENGPVSLRDVFFSTALTKEVGDKAFTTLKNLRSLHFTGNSITLQRTAIPQRPQYLDSLDLSDNEIVELPSDLFTDLPALKYVFLDDNGIMFLPQSTWKSILPQLEFLFINSNPVVCDSRMTWILESNLHHKIVGECASPESLSGREIESLTVADLSD